MSALPNGSGTRAGPRHDFLAVFLMMLLTFVTGVVDAVGYLGLDRVFTGNMTGNIVILGMGVSGADELPVLGPFCALVAFTVGAFASGLILRRAPKAWNQLTTALLAIGGVILLGLAIAMFVAGDELSTTEQIVFAVLTALVMGEQAAVARALAIRDMTTVVVTSTLTSLASESLVGHQNVSALGRIWNRRFGAIAVIFAGAVAGALLLLIHIAIAMILGAVITLVAAAAGHHYLTEHPQSA